MKDLFDRIAASVPLNVTAATVVSSGEHYEPKFTNQAHWKEPPPIRPFPKHAPTSLPNFTGKQHGRLRVLGLHRHPDGNKNAGLRWVVRCVCGRYELRSTKALKAERVTDDGQGDRCQACVHTRKLQRMSSQQRTVEEFLAENGGRS